MLWSLVLPLVFAALSAPFARGADADAAIMPVEKIYGVNLGSWLVLEAWMLPAEWLAMGGENDCDCAMCIGSEFNYVKAYPDTADEAFNKHWETWFSQDDVDILVDAGINTVRIPLGFWLVEALVDRRTEFYPRGGIKQLKRGLKQLKAAGIKAILDHHALPGAQAQGQQFAGMCTSSPQFYTAYNYHRALVWTAVMTSLSHLDPDFSDVFSIEAANEPIMDAKYTPGYGDFQKNFVRTVRAVELVLGIAVPGFTLEADLEVSASASNFTAALNVAAGGKGPAALFTPEVKAALAEAVPILVGMGIELAIPAIFDVDAGSAPFRSDRKPLTTNIMDVNWQNDNPANPADAAIGPQAYDNHLYYSFGGVADANEDAYMISICNLTRVEADAALGDSPLWFGEWGLPTQFNATDAFLMKWADAQKLMYSKGAGWIAWNFKTEISDLAPSDSLARQWSYEEGLRRGYFTQDPSQYHDVHVCDPYIGANATSTATGTSTATETGTATDSSTATGTSTDSSTVTSTSTDSTTATGTSTDSATATGTSTESTTATESATSTDASTATESATASSSSAAPTTDSTATSTESSTPTDASTATAISA